MMVGNEREQWSDTDDGSPADQSEPSNSSDHPPQPLQSRDEYESGDLGDVSCAYVTEGPDKESSGSDEDTALNTTTKQGQADTPKATPQCHTP